MPSSSTSLKALFPTGGISTAHYTHMNLAALILAVVLPVGAVAQEFGSAAYCNQLADIGANAYKTKMQGHSLESVLQRVGYVLADDPRKKQAAQGVIIAVYGDGSIKSANQARNMVYSACTR